MGCCGSSTIVRGVRGLLRAAANTARGDYDPHGERAKRAVCEGCEHFRSNRITARITVLRCAVCSCILPAKWRSGEPCPLGLWE